MALRRIDGTDFVDLTEADITTIQFQVVGEGKIWLARSGSKPAANSIDAWEYDPHEGERGSLSDLFPAETGARLWVRSETDTLIRYTFS